MDDYLAKPFKAESLLRVIKLGVKPSLMIPIDTVETTATIESAINVEPVINVGALEAILSLDPMEVMNC